MNFPSDNDFCANAAERSKHADDFFYTLMDARNVLRTALGPPYQGTSTGEVPDAIRVLLEHINPTDPCVDVPFVGVYEISVMAGVTRAAVSNWRARHPDFPKPVADLRSGPVFRRDHIQLWLNKENRSTSSLDVPQDEDELTDQEWIKALTADSKNQIAQLDAIATALGIKNRKDNTDLVTPIKLLREKLS